jgi:hypothetical protein
MSAVQHTPGPWEARASHGTSDFGIVAQLPDAQGGWAVIGEAFSNIRNSAECALEEAAANARAMAAAPEMLKTLRDLDGWLANTGHADTHPWRISIAAAVAKATGAAS